MTIRILLADHHAHLRRSMHALIDRQSGMEVVAETHNARAAVWLTADLKPDVAIIDISMPDLHGADALRQLRAGAPQVRLLVLSMHSNPEFMEGMLAAGASGYLLKDHAFEELARAVQTVAAGRIYRCPGIESALGEPNDRGKGR